MITTPSFSFPLDLLCCAVLTRGRRGAAETLLAMKAATGNSPLPDALTAALRVALANPTRVCTD